VSLRPTAFNRDVQDEQDDGNGEAMGTAIRDWSYPGHPEYPCEES